MEIPPRRGSQPELASVFFQADEAGGTRHRRGGNMRFPWNMPTGLLFFTTRSLRFAAFLSGTRKPQVQHP
jgi:hypothetical protein